MNNKIAVVGAGCASLTAAAILSSRGYDVKGKRLILKTKEP